MNRETGPTISLLDASTLEARLPDLAGLLRDCVAAGASVNFVLPFGQAEAETFFRDKVLPGVRAGHRFVLVAEETGRILGTVQLACDTPPNQPHRADVTKLLVHPEARRRGIGRALMEELERLANKKGRSLLTLDTRTGDAAEPLYGGLGYVSVGQIPGFSLDPFGSARLDATTLMYKEIGR